MEIIQYLLTHNKLYGKKQPESVGPYMDPFNKLGHSCIDYFSYFNVNLVIGHLKTGSWDVVEYLSKLNTLKNRQTFRTE